MSSPFNISSDCQKIIPHCYHTCKDWGKLVHNGLIRPMEGLFIASISLIAIFKIVRVWVHFSKKKNLDYEPINGNPLPPHKSIWVKIDEQVTPGILVITMLAVIIFSDILARKFENRSTCYNFSTGCYHFCKSWLKSIFNETNTLTDI